MRTNKNLALRPYLEAIQQTFGSLSKKELEEMILTMAREVPANERTLFLRQIESFPPGKRPEKRGAAQSLLQDYCKTRFNRHVAFRNEVKQAVKSSPLLRGMEAGL